MHGSSRAQIPASLRAIDAITEEIHDGTARDVGSRVCGHPGGLSVKERYLLAEKREELLRKTREECKALRIFLLPSRTTHRTQRLSL